jgi:hypothetical protein
MSTFDANDLKSNEGMLTTVWGPAWWLVLHTISFGYPLRPTTEERHNTKAFMSILQKVLPCKYCRENLVKNYKALPLRKDRLKDRAAFSRYVYDLHAHVNKMLEKTTPTPSFEEVESWYERLRVANGKDLKCQIDIVPKRKSRRTIPMKVIPSRTLKVAASQCAENDMIPEVWGPALWHVLHVTSLNFPAEPTKEQMADYGAFVRLLVHVVPSCASREALAALLAERPPEVASRDAFARYVYWLHSQINTQLGKPNTVSYEEMVQKYENFRARCLAHEPKAKKKEKGCTVPLHGKKAMCILNVVPGRTPGATMKVSSECILKRGTCAVTRRVAKKIA